MDRHRQLTTRRDFLAGAGAAFGALLFRPASARKVPPKKATNPYTGVAYGGRYY